jgi:hypothetical protein
MVLYLYDWRPALGPADLVDLVDPEDLATEMGSEMESEMGTE